MDTEAWLLANGEKLQLGLFLGLGVALAVWEGRCVVPRRVAARAQRWPVNLALTALNVALLSLLPLSLLGGGLWANERGFGVLPALGLGGLTALVATLLLRGLVSWYIHAAMHAVPWFWRVHRVHHLDTQLDVSTTVRFHPLEFVIGLASGLPAVVALGLNPAWLAAYEVLDVAVTLFSHAAVRLPGWVERPLRYLVVTPGLHRVHHSSHLPETNSNYSAVFPLWDLLLGTFRTLPPDLLEARRLGLEEVRDARTTSLRWLLVSPWRALPAGASTGVPSAES